MSEKGDLMTEKRFTNIEHDYENAWIKCNDNGDFMIYAIYKELDESLPSLEDLLNELNDKCEFLEIENEALEDAASRYAELCHKSLKENEQFKNKVYSVIDKRINALEDDYNKAVKAGMPSNSVYGEIELLEELKRELEE